MHAMRQIWIFEVPMLVLFDKHFLEASSTVALGRGRDCMENRMRRSGASLPPVEASSSSPIRTSIRPTRTQPPPVIPNEKPYPLTLLDDVPGSRWESRARVSFV
ncbi:hypothetical protein FCULG_00007312 [Fusarium culmorum]|uniref:Uncharacterized protein n=1 Tax=Fusarium culmorum TaxID=5516 RepID=A0A2T4H413_FUSCU|nr:hypothetical protein FCULG_00007312 [Fusarium culmorum]